MVHKEADSIQIYQGGFRCHTAQAEHHAVSPVHEPPDTFIFSGNRFLWDYKSPFNNTFIQNKLCKLGKWHLDSSGPFAFPVPLASQKREY